VENLNSSYKGKYDHEIVISVSDWYHDQMRTLIPQFLSRASPTEAGPVLNSVLLNDTQNLTVSIEPGKTYLFRMVNIGAFAGQYIWFEGHTMSIVEVDGIYTNQADATMIYLAAAQRCSFLITAKNDTTTNYAFVTSMDTVRSLCYPVVATRLQMIRNSSITFLLVSTTTAQDGLSMIVITYCQILQVLTAWILSTTLTLSHMTDRSFFPNRIKQ
jgi:FtsP/CotA-like multicopper oxidase with cupredoxin domain